MLVVSMGRERERERGCLYLWLQHVVSFVINANNFTSGYHGYINTVMEEHSSYTLRQCTVCKMRCSHPSLVYENFLVVEGNLHIILVLPTTS